MQLMKESKNLLLCQTDVLDPFVSVITFESFDSSDIVYSK